MGNHHQLHRQWPKARRRAHSESLIGGYHYYHLSQHINSCRAEEVELGDIDVKCQGQHFWDIFGKGYTRLKYLKLKWYRITLPV